MIFAQEQLITKTFEVPVNFLQLLEQQDINRKASAISDQFSTEPQPVGLMSLHELVSLPGCKAIFNPEAGRFTVTSTKKQLELIESLLATFPKFSEAEQRNFVSSIKIGPAAPTELRESSERAKLRRKLKEIKIPNLEFKDTPFNEALQILQKLSVEFDHKEADPNQKGVNLIISGPYSGFQRQRATPESKIAPATVTLNFSNITLEEALQHSVEQVEGRFRVREYAVVFSPLSFPEEKQRTTRFLLPANIYEKLVSTLTKLPSDPFAPDYSEDELPEIPIEQLALERSGISFIDGANVRYDKKTGELFVTNTPFEMDLITGFLSSLDDGKIILGHDSKFHRKTIK